MKKSGWSVIALLLLAIVFGGCAPASPLPVLPTASPFILSKPSFTPTLTPTMTSTATLTRTSTATPELIISSDNAENLIQLESLPVGTGIADIAFTQSNDIAFIRANDRMIHVLDLAGKIQNSIAPFPERAGSQYNWLKVSPDGTRVAVAETYYIPPLMKWPNHWHATVHVRGLQDATVQQDVDLPAGIAAVSNDFNTIALFLNNAYSGNVQIWRLSGERYQRAQEIRASGQTNMCMSPDSSVIATDYLDNILLWNTKDGTRLATLSGAGAPTVFSNDGGLLAAKTDKAIQIWRLTDKTQLQTIPYSGRINKIAFSPNSQMVAASIATDILVWKVSDGSLIKRISAIDGNHLPKTIVFSPDGKLLAFDQFNSIEIWGVAKDGFLLATETPTMDMRELDQYKIDPSKLFSLPASYRELISNPDQYARAPNPITETNLFTYWWTKSFVPALGDVKERKVNLRVDAMGLLGDFYDAWNSSSPKPLSGRPGFAFFIDKGTVYPIMVLNVGYTEIATIRTVAIILYSGVGAPQGTNVIEAIAKGEKIMDFRIICKNHDVFPGIVREIIESGLAGQDNTVTYVLLGIGGIRTESCEGGICANWTPTP